MLAAAGSQYPPHSLPRRAPQAREVTHKAIYGLIRERERSMFFTQGIWPWVLFNAFVVVLLALDLGVFHRHSHTVSTREALTWSAVWIGLALAFNLGIYIFQGPDLAL